MIEPKTVLTYSNMEAETLREARDWVTGELNALPFQRLVTTLDNVFDGEWMGWRLLWDTLGAKTIILTLEEAIQLRELFGVLLIGKQKSFSSKEGRLLAPLLYDLANINANQAPAVKHYQVRGAR